MTEPAPFKPVKRAAGRAAQTARGIAWNWVAVVFGFTVTFFLSPFVVHQLGNLGYGVWTVLVSTISYLGLLDLGLRGAVTRFVSQHHAQGDHAAAGRAVSAALWLRQWIGLAIVALSLLLSLGIDRLFDIPAELRSDARWVVLLAGTSLAFSLALGVFGGVLAALHRFDLIGGMTIVQTLVRACGVVWILRSGHGILALAAWELLVVVSCNLALAALSFRVYPDLAVSLRFPARALLIEFWRYSSYVFLIHVFGQVIYYTDNLVVGAVISVSAVTFFAIGGSLNESLRQVLGSITPTFMPLASRFEASGEHDQLRRLLIYGTRIALVMILPIHAALFCRGQTFIGLWMGQEYAVVSSRVLQILLVAQVFIAANSTSLNIVLGLGKHRQYAIWLVGESAANLVLSVVLAREIGIYGVALGTVIPSLVVHMVLWPRYICRLLEIPVARHIFQSWIRPALAVVPFAIACYAAERYWPAASLAGFVLQIALLLPIYALAVLASFWKDVRLLWRTRLA